MSNDVGLEKENTLERSSAPLDTGTASQMNGKGWLKGGLTMAICCGASLLMIIAISFFGLSPGALASGALSLAAILACLVGMLLMIRTMNKP